jgi:hypothetical protein
MPDYSQQEHCRVLERILHAEPSMRDDIETRRSFPFDVPEPLVSFTVAVALEVLGRHERGLITDDDLEAWADALEVRPDVEPDAAHDDLLKECLFELSEPIVSGMPMPALAKAWRDKLARVASQQS